jgi:ubiquinone/menaquinone biosynthesis C-methylase UbiE
MTHSQNKYRETLNALVGSNTRWLDLGCGHTIFPEWMRDSIAFQKELLSRCELARGCDPVDDRPHVAGLVKKVYQGEKLPFDDGYFNLVTANMVAEHVENPLSFAQEVSRVLSPGGLFVIHTPNFYYFEIFAASLLPNSLVRRIAHHLDGRESEDIFRTYYRMNTRKALDSLSGFKAKSLECVETAPQFGKIPVLNLVESALIRLTRLRSLGNLRADWIAVLQKVDGSSFPNEPLDPNRKIDFDEENALPSN